MIEEEFGKLLNKTWSEEEENTINKIMLGLVYYKRLIPKSLKTDIVAAIQLCICLKDRLEQLQLQLQLQLQSVDDK